MNDHHAPRNQAWFEANRANWDERTPVHVASAFYGVEEFLAGESRLHRFEEAELTDVAGASLVHLQCHFGLDTLSWARHGARVTGLDFSEPAIDAARKLAARAGLEATFVLANVYDAAAALGETYDVVYTGKGAFNWLPDLNAWADVVMALLRPGGRLYVSEFHPMAWTLDDEALTIAYDYFAGDEPYVDDDPRDYADPDARLESARTYEWPHPLGEVVTALTSRGFRLQFLHEFTQCSFQRFPFMVEIGRRHWEIPDGLPKVPLMYSLLAHAPEG